MQLIIDATNPRNESTLSIVSGETEQHVSAEAFFSAAVVFLNHSWEPPEISAAYVQAARSRRLSSDELQQLVADCIALTPIGDFKPPLEQATDATTFYDEWNAREIVWRSGTRYWLVSWGTAA